MAAALAASRIYQNAQQQWRMGAILSRSCALQRQHGSAARNAWHKQKRSLASKISGENKLISQRL